MVTSIKKGLSGALGGVFSCPASFNDLKDILEEQKVYAYNRHHYHEVYPGIFLGDAVGAKDICTLEKLRVTHVLNAAFGSGTFLYVDTDRKYYIERSFKCEFKGIPAIDIYLFNMSLYFYEAADFIESALKNNGRIYVHCQQGVSRSASLVIVFLMIKHKMPAVEALKLVRSRRAICPNDGFLQQICDLDSYLQRTQNRSLKSTENDEMKAESEMGQKINQYHSY